MLTFCLFGRFFNPKWYTVEGQSLEQLGGLRALLRGPTVKLLHWPWDKTYIPEYLYKKIMFKMECFLQQAAIASRVENLKGKFKLCFASLGKICTGLQHWRAGNFNWVCWTESWVDKWSWSKSRSLPRGQQQDIKCQKPTTEMKYEWKAVCITNWDGTQHINQIN